MISVCRRKKSSASDLLGWPVTSAGRRRKVAGTGVSHSDGHYSILLKLIIIIGHHHVQEASIKEEPKSPTQKIMRRCKAYSTVNGTSIGEVEVLDEDPTSTSQPPGKRARMAAGSSRFEGVVIPKITRKSTRNTKESPKADMAEMYRRLGRELAAVAKTFDEMAYLME